MPSLLTKSLAASFLAAASLTAGAQTLITKIPVSTPGGISSAAVAVDSAMNRIYLLVSPNTETPAQLLVINGATNKVVGAVAGLGNGYDVMVIDSVRSIIYLQGGCFFQSVNMLTNKIGKSFQLPGSYCGPLALDSVTGKVYVQETGTLYVIESEAGGTIDTFSLPGFADYDYSGLVASPYVHRLYIPYYVADSSGVQGYLGFFDTLTNQISKSVTIPADFNGVSGLAVDPNTGHLFATTNYTYTGEEFYSSSVAVYNSAGTLLANVLPTDQYPFRCCAAAIVVDPKSNRAFVSANGDSGVSVYTMDGASNTVISSVLLGYLDLVFSENGLANLVAVNPDTSRLYVFGDSQSSDSFTLNVYSEQ